MYTISQLKEIEISKKFYFDNKNKIFFLYQPINYIFPSFFKKKIDYFYEISEPYLSYKDYLSKSLSNKIVAALVEDKYTVNSLFHYHFNIDGVEHIYGISSITDLIDKANVIKFKKSQKNSCKLKSNVIESTNRFKNRT